MTDEERAAMRTAYRPFMEALMGRKSSVSQEEWAAAVDRIFPPSGQEGGLRIFMQEDGSNITTHIKAPPGMSPADAIAAARRLRLHLGFEIDRAAGCPVHTESATSDSDVRRESNLDFSLIGSTILHLKQRIDYRLNDHLVEMKPGYDDSITGFNAAWDVVREIFKEATDNLRSNMPETGR